jgi:type IV secretion system protein VirB9
MKHWIAGLLLCITLVPAAGAYQAFAEDARIRTLPYDADAVVELDTSLGYHTLIEFDPGETIVDVANGLPDGWDAARLDHVLIIRPRRLDAGTNLSVITTRRIYAFALKVRPIKESHGTSKLGDASQPFIVRFTYVDEHARIDATLRPPGRNTRFEFQGAEELVPVKAEDDGLFTYLAFGPTQAIPAIFAVNADGSESLVNQFSEGDTVIVKQISDRFTLRLGTRVACLFDIDSQQAQHERSSTTVPSLVRKIKPGIAP